MPSLNAARRICFQGRDTKKRGAALRSSLVGRSLFFVHSSTMASARRNGGAMDPDAIDHVVRKHAIVLWVDSGYSAHSMRATFIMTALENGAQLDVQKGGRAS